MAPTNTSVVVRSPKDLASATIRTPQEFADVVREMQQQAHILSPAVAVSEIPPHYVINTAVVPIDPNSADVYSGSFHKKTREGSGQNATYHPVEVSLSKTGLLKILTAAGIKITFSDRVDDGTVPLYWRWRCEGAITDFDGSIRPLPPGNEEVDLRDGSAQIGGWTPEEWAKREAAAEEQRQRTPAADRWKVKPEPIDGWTRERVMGARTKGLNLASAKAMNSLIRNLGLKQKYTVAELRKPFVIFRVTFIPNMNNPQVEEMVTAAHLGASRLLYTGTPPTRKLVSGDVIDVHASSPDADADEGTASTPEGAQDIDDLPDDAPAESAAAEDPVFHVPRLAQLGERFFAETAEGITFTTTDRQVARVLNEARKAGHALHLDGDEVEIEGRRYREVTDARRVESQQKAGVAGEGEY